MNIHAATFGSAQALPLAPSIEGMSIVLFGLTDPKVRERAVRAAKARHESKRRQKIDPTTCERDYTGPEIEFMKAIQDYKQFSGRQFPTWSEVLEVVTDLGYAKLA